MLCVRLKRDGKTAKEIPLIGKGVQAFINSFSGSSLSLAQRRLMRCWRKRKKKEMANDNWIIKRAEDADNQSSKGSH